MAILASRRRAGRGWRQLAFLVVAAFLMVSKVWSQQYVLWLLPLVVLARPRWGAFLAWQAAEVCYFFAFYGELWAHIRQAGLPRGGVRPRRHPAPGHGGGAVRLVVRDILRPGTTWCGHLPDDPDGGVFDGAPDGPGSEGWSRRHRGRGRRRSDLRPGRSARTGPGDGGRAHGPPVGEIQARRSGSEAGTPPRRPAPPGLIPSRSTGASSAPSQGVPATSAQHHHGLDAQRAQVVDARRVREDWLTCGPRPAGRREPLPPLTTGGNRLVDHSITSGR